MKKSVLLFVTLALLLSFATVNAVLFTPALPMLASLYHVSEHSMEATFLWFLAGYCLGQLCYSPLGDRFGRKPALFFGIGLQIFSNILALYAGYFEYFNVLIFSRFILALGSGVGLVMTFTIVSEYYAKEHVHVIISYLIPAFAIVPALGVLMSGYLTNIYGWPANFYLATIYGLVMIAMCSLLPSSNKKKDFAALNIKKIIRIFQQQLQNNSLIINGMLMGCCVAFVYIFSSLVPFITTSYFKFNTIDYGMANAFSAIGLLVGSIIGTKIHHFLSNRWVIGFGVISNIIGSIGIFLGEYYILSAFVSFFIPFFLINLGSCCVLSHASSSILNDAADKPGASGVMSFINVGTTTLVVLVFSYLPLSHYLLAATFVGLSLGMFVLMYSSK